MVKFDVRICGETCKGCGLCIAFCPKKILTVSTLINNKGYSPTKVAVMEDCIGCKSCALFCPDGAISIYREDAADE